MKVAPVASCWYLIVTTDIIASIVPALRVKIRGEHQTRPESEQKKKTGKEYLP